MQKLNGCSIFGKNGRKVEERDAILELNRAWLGIGKRVSFGAQNREKPHHLSGRD
jgi:hypothetical protein